MSAVRLPRAIVNQLLHLAQKSPEEEICGLISRDRTGFRKCYPVANAAGDRKRFFTLDPKQQIEAMRAMRERGEELAAIYHSHPDAPPLPSLADIEQHEYPGVLYLIISLGTQGVLEMRGFHIRGRSIEEAAIGLQDEPAS
ncbi:MAG: M67 family metallopeptidase [Gammaproteobacteria bacterium]|nr:M67 family metallopeptidase [Gammaproteobacteria bacterium]